MRNLLIRPLKYTDKKDVKNIDLLSGNYVEQWLADNDDYAWGIFYNNALVGYCTVGYADYCPECISNYYGFTNDSLLLSDVYIKKEFRRKGLGSEMIKRVLNARVPDGELVFITLLYDDLSIFYSKLGFEWVDDSEEYCMVKNKWR